MSEQEFFQIGNFTIDGLLGILFGAFVGHSLAIRRTKNDRSHKLYLSLATPIRESLVKGIMRIDNGEVGFKVAEDLYNEIKSSRLKVNGAVCSTNF